MIFGFILQLDYALSDSDEDEDKAEEADEQEAPII